MGSFAVIQVFQDCDYVEDVICLATFHLESEALAFVEDKKEAVNDSYFARREYIENYVDENITIPVIDYQKCQNYENSISPFGSPSDLPKIDYQKWQEFKRPFAPFGSTYRITPDNFIAELKNFLINNKAPEILVNFNPPAIIYGMHNLFVVEIQEAGGQEAKQKTN